jgi:gamma-glutamyl-gamma-aminobutyraldehyde dehydrogenase
MRGREAAMKSLAHFENVARAIDLPNLAVIDGRLETSVTGRTFDNVTPRNGAVINRVAECDVADVDKAVAAARRAFEDGRWRSLHYREKKRILFALAELIEGNAETLAVLESLDVGKPIKDALNIDVPQSVRTLRYYAEALDKVYGEVGPETSDRFSFAVHEPLGVVGAIVPWNFPMLMALWKVAPALAMGNSVVLKPAEQSPLTALKLGQLALEAGLPAGVLNVVPGFGPTAGKALALHVDVDMIAFTGSGAVGRLLLHSSTSYS